MSEFLNIFSGWNFIDRVRNFRPWALDYYPPISQKIVNGVLYSIADATLVVKITYEANVPDYLYVTEKGKWFIADSHDLRPLSTEQAKEYLEDNLLIEQLEQYFGPIERA